VKNANKGEKDFLKFLDKKLDEILKICEDIRNVKGKEKKEFS